MALGSVELLFFEAALKKMTAEKRRLGKTAQKANAKKVSLALKKAGKGIFLRC